MSYDNHHAAAQWASAGASIIDPVLAPLTEQQMTIEGQDARLLPVANIGRIMKRALPSSFKMTKEAKTACQIAVSEFICLITAEASDRMVEDGRRTITGIDLLDALRALGFEEYMTQLEPMIQHLRQKKAQA